MPDSNLSLFPHVFNPPLAIPPCGKIAGRINRARIVALLQAAWAAGETPLPKCIAMDLSISEPQVNRHLRALEGQGVVVLRRGPCRWISVAAPPA